MVSLSVFRAVFSSLALPSAGVWIVGWQKGSQPASQGAGEPKLTVYCAAGLKRPVEAVAAQYREEFGVEVALQYGGTGTLLSQLRVANRGDVFIAADQGAVESVVTVPASDPPLNTTIRAL